MRPLLTNRRVPIAQKMLKQDDDFHRCRLSHAPVCYSPTKGSSQALFETSETRTSPVDEPATCPRHPNTQFVVPQQAQIDVKSLQARLVIIPLQDFPRNWKSMLGSASEIKLINGEAYECERRETRQNASFLIAQGRKLVKLVLEEPRRNTRTCLMFCFYRREKAKRTDPREHMAREHMD